MRVALVVDDGLDSPDGVQQYVLTLGSWLTGQGHDVQYISSHTEKNIPGLHVISPNVKVRFNKNRLRIPLPASPRKIQTLINRGNFDVVHVQMPYSPQLAGRVIKGLPDTTGLVGTFHILPFGSLQTSGGKMLAWVVRPTLRRFDSVMAVSKHDAEHAAKTYDIKKPLHVPNMVDKASYTQSKDTIVPGRVVFLGRLVPRKGVLELLKAVRILHKTHMPVNFELFIAGSGPERDRLESYCKRYKLDGVVRFEGFVSEKRKKQLLATAQIAVFPSLGGESFGIVLLEAMAAGSQVVLAGNNPGYASVMSSVPQTLIDPNNPKLFASILAELLDNPAKRETIHTKQQQLVERYDVAVVGPQVSKLYAQAIEKRRKEVHTKNRHKG